MKYCYFILTLFLIALTTQVSAQDSLKPKRTRFEELDEYARKAPKECEENNKKLAEYLIIPAQSDLEKARLIFTWVATHLKYDASAYNSGKITDQSSSSVLKKKRAVCEGYSNLMKELCDHAGLECEKVSGYSKGYGYKQGKKFKETTHAWNAIKINGSWHLFDATWASGYGKEVDGKLKNVSRFDPYWFDVDPKQFIFTHMPEQNKWQLLPEPIALRQFENMPRVDDTFFKLGFDTEKTFNDAIGENAPNFAITYTLQYPLKAIQAPVNEVITKGETTDFVFQSDVADEMVLIDGKKWIPFSKEGNTFTLSHSPKHKHIRICCKTKKQGKKYSGVIDYKAKK